MKKIFSENYLLGYLIVIATIIVFIRCIAIISSPLELSPDEAQYWLWSKNLSWGYFSKPPLIAWLIRISNIIFGDNDFSIRILSPVLHGITSVIIYFLSKEITSNHFAHFLSSIIWLTLPIVGVGSFLMSTDTPLMMLWSISLLVIFKTYNSKKGFNWFISGLISGLAIYAKYAAIFLPFGLILFFLVTIKKGSEVKLNHVLLYFLSFLLVSIPNILWNFFNNFYTVFHLSSNAVIDTPNYSLIGSLFFLSSQLIVIGPLMFITFLISLSKIKNFNSSLVLLLYFVVPVFLVMLIQGYFSEANANWAATALPGLSIFCGYYLSTHFKTASFSIITNLIISLIIIIISITGNLTFFDLKSDPLRKLKGWQMLGKDIVNLISKEESNLILVDRRGIAAELIYYLRNQDIEVRVPKSSFPPSNHYQLYYSINEKEKDQFYYLTENEINTDDKRNEYSSYRISIIGKSKSKISTKKNRVLYFYFFEKT